MPSTMVAIARKVLFAFLCTFVAARVLVFFIMARKIPDFYLHLGGTHVHHLNYGIFLLAGVGAYLLFGKPTGRGLTTAALLYGMGLALTFDEFGMWVHLGGSYWQRASWDAVAVVAAVLGLVACAPGLRHFRPHHWWSAVAVAVAVTLFFGLLYKSFDYTGKRVAPRLRKIEADAPP